MKLSQASAPADKFDPPTWMIVREVGFDLAKNMLAHSSRSGAEIAAEGRERWVRVCLTGH